MNIPELKAGVLMSNVTTSNIGQFTRRGHEPAREAEREEMQAKLLAAVADGVRLKDIGPMLGLTTKQVEGRLRRLGVKKTGYRAQQTKLKADIVAMTRKGMTAEQVGKSLGITKNAVRGHLRRSRGIASKSRAGDCGVGRGMEIDMSIVPAWVPDDMRRDYAECAALEGEESASKWAREEKKQRKLRSII